jgi:polyhydroxybutyrate depolymerase
MRFVFLLCFTTVLASCSSDSGSTAASAEPSLGCQDNTLDGSSEHVDLDFGGTRRSYELHVPSSYDGDTPVPLVLNFHGLTQTGNAQREQSYMDAKSDEEGFIVAYPNGIDNAWNSGRNPSNSVDDVGFTRALIDDLGARGCIDLRRVYATGMSNGGGMSHRLACEAADVIAAVAPHSGQLALDPSECLPSRTIPILDFHGKNDTIASYDGVPEMIAAWAERDGCTDPPEVTFEQGDVTCTSQSQCEGGASVTLCTADEAGHCWFGYECPIIGAVDLGGSTEAIKANEAMWELFERTVLP